MKDDMTTVADEINQLLAKAPNSGPYAAAVARVADETPEQREAAYRRDQSEALREQATERFAFRSARYAEARPAEYARADIGDLLPQQNPDGRGQGWLACGAKNALIMGPSGHGKSHLAFAVANAAIKTGMWVEAWSVLELVQALSPLPVHARSDTVRSLRQEVMFDAAKNCDLLLLDDLGPEEAGGYVADRWRSQLLEILTARDVEPRCRTIVTINGGTTADLPTEEAKVQARRSAAHLIDTRYSARVATRIQRDCIGIWVEGECLRKAATWDPF